MKRTIPFMMIIIILFMSSCQPENHQYQAPQQEIRGIWISCYDHISAKNKTEAEYREETDKMFQTISACGLNTAFVHLRAFSDAFYESDLFPYSSFIAGSQGAELNFDPFEVMLESAEKNGISVHGWINPFRVSSKANPSRMSEKNPAKQILNSGNVNGEICILSNGIYYNPSCESNHKLVLDGVKEIVNKYDINGIHIDDYFYPSVSDEVDIIQYSQYISSGGKLSLEEWRITNVNAFVSSLYSAVKAINPEITVSISPAADMAKNKSELFADCELWLTSDGYADIIIPQIYYGFEHNSLAFEQTLNKWCSPERKVALACGIAAYKCGKEDEFAGSGHSEWQNNSDILARQISTVTANKNYTGFVIFSYSDLIREDAQKEIKNLKELINTWK